MKVHSASESAHADLNLHIATGKNNRGKVKNKSTKWLDLSRILANPVTTGETLAEYMKLSKAEQSELKNVGGFWIGGSCDDGRCATNAIQFRDVITFDINDASPDIVERLELGLTGISGYEWIAHSTRKHVSEKPRLRIVIPLEKPLDADRYMAAARIFAVALDSTMDMIDDGSFQVAQRMYWPSHSSDSEFVFIHNTGVLLNAQAMLDAFGDWQDFTKLPFSDKQGQKRPSAKKAEDPTTKPGLIAEYTDLSAMSDDREDVEPGAAVPEPEGTRYDDDIEDLICGKPKPMPLERMNEKHAASRIGGDLLILTFSRDGGVHFGLRTNPDLLNANVEMPGPNGSPVPISACWVKQKGRWTYRGGVSFKPGGMSSKEDYVVSATAGERRHAVFNVSPHMAKNQAYFAAIPDERDNGGPGTLLHLLQNWDLSNFDVVVALDTKGLANQKLAELRNLDAWWFDTLTNGHLPRSPGFDESASWEDGSVRVNMDAFYGSYEDWMKGRRQQGELFGQQAFGHKLVAICPGRKKVQQRVGRDRVWRYILPSLPECRAAFEKWIGADVVWAEDDVSDILELL